MRDGTTGYIYIYISGRNSPLENTSGQCLTEGSSGPEQYSPKPEGGPTTKACLDVIASGPAGGSAVITQKSSGPAKKAEVVNPGASESDPVPRGFRVTKEFLDRLDYTRVPEV